MSQAVVRIPTPLRSYTGGADELQLPGRSVRELLDKKWAAFGQRLFMRTFRATCIYLAAFVATIVWGPRGYATGPQCAAVEGSLAPTKTPPGQTRSPSADAEFWGMHGRGAPCRSCHPGAAASASSRPCSVSSARAPCIANASAFHEKMTSRWR